MTPRRFSRAKRRLPQTITRAEWERLASQPSRSAPTGVRNLALMVVMYDAGLRESEACRLRLGDVIHTGPNAGTLRVHRGKGGRDRANLALPPGSWATLLRWLELRERRAIPGRLVFPTLAGGELSTRYVRQFVTRYSERAGVARADGKPINPHMLRHTYASRLLGGGATIAEVQLALGHSRLETTAVYLHVDDRRLAGRLRGALELADADDQAHDAGQLDFSRMATR